MKYNELKETVCRKHEALLRLILEYGNGAMLLPQLKQLAPLLLVEQYSSGQALGRAARALRTAGVLKRMTWIDNNSDLLICCKYALRYFNGDGATAAKKYTTVNRYLLQCAKVDYLIKTIQHRRLSSLEQVAAYLASIHSTVFLRLPDLTTYFQTRPPFAAHNQPEYTAQLRKLREGDEARRRLAAHQAPPPTALPAVPIVTIEQLHRRNLYLSKLTGDKAVLTYFDFTGKLTADKLISWAIDAFYWVKGLLPKHQVLFAVYAPDESTHEALLRRLKAKVNGMTCLDHRLAAQHLLGADVHITVQNSDTLRRWCGGIKPIL